MTRNQPNSTSRRLRRGATERQPSEITRRHRRILQSSAFLAILLGTVVLGACTGGPDTATVASGTADVCPTAEMEGRLLRDDGSGFIVQHEEGFVVPIVWPDGYSVRDGQARELIDPRGTVVAKEGDFVVLGGGMIEGDSAFEVCGPFTVRAGT